MEKNGNNKEIIEIDLLEVLMVLLGKLWLIICLAIVGGAIGYALSTYVVPATYKSTTKIYILNKQDSNTVTYSDVQLGTQLTKDYAEMIQSRTVLEEVIEELELSDLTYETLGKKIKVETMTDTRILAITVTDTDPSMAKKIANAVRESASVHIENVMDIEAVNVVDMANYPEKKAAPSVVKWTAAGVVIAVFLTMALILLSFVLDDTIKTSEDVEKYLGLSTLAIIPLEAGTKQKKKKRKSKKAKGYY